MGNKKYFLGACFLFLGVRPRTHFRGNIDCVTWFLIFVWTFGMCIHSWQLKQVQEAYNVYLRTQVLKMLLNELNLMIHKLDPHIYNNSSTIKFSQHKNLSQMNKSDMYLVKMMDVPMSGCVSFMDAFFWSKLFIWGLGLWLCHFRQFCKNYEIKIFCLIYWVASESYN